VSAELEGRIRASLSAYAELVDETDDVALPVRRRTAGPVRRWRAPLLVAAAVASAVTIGVSVWPGVTSGGDSAATSAADGGGLDAADTGGEAGAEQEERAEAPEDTAMSATTDALALPEVGVPTPYDLYTHCGVLGAFIGGAWFAADPPLVEGAGNPPAGWGNPYQTGSLTLLTADEAVFTDDVGHEVRLVSAPEETPPPCD